MATGTAGNQARFQQRQVVNTWRKQINFNDANNGVNVPGVVVPSGAMLSMAMVEIVVAFDGTPSILVGTNANCNDIVAAGDVTEGTIGVYIATRGYGGALFAAGDTTIYTRLTSTTPTVGRAEVMLQYEANTG